MEEVPKDILVLGAIRKGAKSFKKILKQTKIQPEELDEILKRLEERGLMEPKEKKGLFGKKVELYVTEKGYREVEARIHELEQNWNQLVSLYKSGDKEKLDQEMNSFRGMLPMMMFFGIMDMMMFSMMLNMMGTQMHDYVPADQVPDGVDTGDAGDMSSDSMADGDHGGFDIDIGF